MKNQTTIILVLFTVLISQWNYSQNTMTTADLSLISGNWTGTLTYIDYGTNKPYTMPATVTVEPRKNEYEVQLLINYPKEPNANSKEKIKLSKDGSLLNKHRIVSRKLITNNEIEIITEYQGKDNNEKALIRTIYVFGQKRFIIRKEVKFADTANWLKRNEYNFIR